MDHVGGLPAQTNVCCLQLQTNAKSSAEGRSQSEKLKRSGAGALLQQRLQRRVCKRPAKKQKRLRQFSPPFQHKQHSRKYFSFSQEGPRRKMKSQLAKISMSALLMHLGLSLTRRPCDGCSKMLSLHSSALSASCQNRKMKSQLGIATSTL